MSRLFRGSLKAVARQMLTDPRLAEVRAVGGATALFSPEGNTGALRLMQRLGFTVTPYQGPMGRFGEFWENLYSWWLMWTFNTVTLRHRRFLALRRAEIWMPAEGFVKRYGRSPW
jgi:hypothetical protein